MAVKIEGGCTLWARKTLESDIFYLKPDKWFKIWFYIVGKVSHKDSKRFKQGSGFFKYDWIMDACSATKSTVDHFMRWAKKEQMLATRKATRGFYITVLNYHLYQDMNVYYGDTKSDLKATQKRHSSYKNGKNDIKEEPNTSTRESKKPPMPSKPISTQPNEVDINLTQRLISWMQKNDPKSSIIRNLTERRQLTWIDSCRLLRERDGRTLEEIKLVIDFSQNDDFWKSNILSMSKLREKFNQLWLKAKPGRSLDEKIDAWAKGEDDE